jgi:hypothetical protein
LAELQTVARNYVDTYTDPLEGFAFTTYDLAETHSGSLTPGDVLMANLLSLRLDWRDVIPLFAAGDGPYTKLREALDEALEEARGLPPFEDCSQEQVAMPALRHANELAEECPRHPTRRARGWTIVTVSKVLHRLAPTVPLVDSRVRAFYGTLYGAEFRRRLWADIGANRDWLSELATCHQIRESPMPLTRVADIIIWMDGNPATRQAGI